MKRTTYVLCLLLGTSLIQQPAHASWYDCFTKTKIRTLCSAVTLAVTTTYAGWAFRTICNHPMHAQQAADISPRTFLASAYQVIRHPIQSLHNWWTGNPIIRQWRNRPVALNRALAPTARAQIGQLIARVENLIAQEHFNEALWALEIADHDGSLVRAVPRLAALNARIHDELARRGVGSSADTGRYAPDHDSDQEREDAQQVVAAVSTTRDEHAAEPLGCARAAKEIPATAPTPTQGLAPFIAAYMHKKPDTTQYVLTVWQTSITQGEEATIEGFRLEIDQSARTITRTPLRHENIPNTLRDTFLELAPATDEFTEPVGQWHATDDNQQFDISPAAIDQYITQPMPVAAIGAAEEPAPRDATESAAAPHAQPEASSANAQTAPQPTTAEEAPIAHHAELVPFISAHLLRQPTTENYFLRVWQRNESEALSGFFSTINLTARTVTRSNTQLCGLGNKMRNELIHTAQPIDEYREIVGTWQATPEMTHLDVSLDAITDYAQHPVPPAAAAASASTIESAHAEASTTEPINAEPAPETTHSFTQSATETLRRQATFIRNLFSWRASSANA